MVKYIPETPSHIVHVEGNLYEKLGSRGDTEYVLETTFPDLFEIVQKLIKVDSATNNVEDSTYVCEGNDYNH